MIFVRARLGENLDPAISQLVVFRRKWILIDANLADGRFRRQLSGSETVDVHLSAVRSSGRPGKSFEIGLQLIGIVGQRLEFFARNHDGAGIVGGIHVHCRRGVGNLNLLLFDRDGELHIQPQGLAGNFYIVVFIDGEPLGDDVQGVFARRQAFKFVDVPASWSGPSPDCRQAES